MQKPLLERACLSGQLEAGLLKACLTQSYSNPGSTELEVVYTFPLPFHATITEVSAELGEKQLRGVVKAHKESEEDYEKAIAEGDSAILVEMSDTGLYTANLGNLRSGERLTVSMHFVQIIDWYHDQARLMFPTTIAPRYGDAQLQGRLPAHADTGTSITAEYGFELDLLVRGAMAKALVASPSHPIKQSTTEDGALRVHLAEKAFLDRDFIVRLDGLTAPETELMVETAGDEHFVLATFYPPLPQAPERPGKAAYASRNEASGPWVYPLRVKLLVDCSGSMEGDAIESARKGIHALVDGLSGKDQVAVARFGSHLEQVLETPQPADSTTRAVLKRWLAGLDADLGGTELQAALDSLLQSTPKDEAYDVLLITDGAVWDIGASVDRAKKSGHRIFAVGVGSSPGESLLRELVEQTGGAALFVYPTEDMTQALHRLVGMMRGPRVSDVELAWACETAQCARLSEHLYAGVPFRAAAMIKGPIDRESQSLVSIQYRMGQQSHHLHSRDPLAVTDLGVRQLVAKACMHALDPEDQPAFAQTHQLLSAHTAWILVHVRDEGDKAGALPEFAQVPSMHVAGSHGFGTVQVFRQVYDHDVRDSQSAGFSSLWSPEQDASVRRYLAASSASSESPVDSQDLVLRQVTAFNAAPINVIDIPAFSPRPQPRQELEHAIEEFVRIADAADSAKHGMRQLEMSLGDRRREVEFMLDRLERPPKTQTPSLHELWQKAQNAGAVRAKQSRDPQDLMHTLQRQITEADGALKAVRVMLDEVFEIAQASAKYAADALQKQSDDRDAEPSGQRVMLSALLGSFADDADLEALWDWVQRLSLPEHLCAQLASLQHEHALAKAQVVALLVLMLLDDAADPRPSRQQMRVLNHVLRDLRSEQIEAFKQGLHDAIELAPG